MTPLIPYNKYHTRKHNEDYEGGMLDEGVDPGHRVSDSCPDGTHHVELQSLWVACGCRHWVGLRDGYCHHGDCELEHL